MTIKDIAKMAGVSVSTVSRVLNQHPEVSASIRAQVLAVVEETGFVPNRAARSLVRAKSSCIGIVCCDKENPAYKLLLEEIVNRLDESGCEVIIRRISIDEDPVQAALAVEREEKLSGLILIGNSSDVDPQTRQRLSVPVVCCCAGLEADCQPWSPEAVVSVDHTQLGYASVRLLVDHGASQLAILLPENDDASVSGQRLRGAEMQCEEMGLAPIQRVYSHRHQLDCAYQAVSELLSSGVAVDGLVATSEPLAVAAVKALHDHGIEVPKHCVVVGMDLLETTRFTLPTLAGYVLPVQELASGAANAILKLSQADIRREVIIESQFRTGGSLE